MGMSPYSTTEEKLAYVKERFKGWTCVCYRLPWTVAGFGGKPVSGFVVVRDPAGFTVIGDIDTQRPRFGDDDLGVRFNRGDELTFGVGPNPFDTYFFMWWARNHWRSCEHHLCAANGRMSMLLFADGKYHEGTLVDEDIIAYPDDEVVSNFSLPLKYLDAPEEATTQS